MQTLAQLLPPAEMGTAQQENPVATFKTASFDVSLTLEEVWMLTEGLEALRRQYAEGLLGHSDNPYALDTLLEEFKKITS